MPGGVYKMNPKGDTYAKTAGSLIDPYFDSVIDGVCRRDFCRAKSNA
jgi:hypothetical protein